MVAKKTHSKHNPLQGITSPCNCLAMFEYTAALLYLLLLALSMVDLGAILNTNSYNSITANLTALVMLCVVSATLGFCVIWVFIFSQHYGIATKGEQAKMWPSHFRPMRIHFFCFSVFAIILQIMVTLFYLQVSGNQSTFQDRYVGSQLIANLDVRIYIFWQQIKVVIFAYGPLEALLFTWCLIQHRNPREFRNLKDSTTASSIGKSAEEVNRHNSTSQRTRQTSSSKLGLFT
jgi:hypothetical protein